MDSLLREGRMEEPSNGFSSISMLVLSQKTLQMNTAIMTNLFRL